MKILETSKEKIVLSIPSTIYSIAVIHKCFYWYCNQIDVSIEQEGKNFIIELTRVPQDESLEVLISSIKRSLIDFQTREIIHQETKDIRTLLIAKAFAYDENFDESPPGVLEDPVGFSPNDFDI